MGMMHNVTARLNSSFFFGVTLLGILAGVNVFTSFFIEQPAIAKVNNIKVTDLVKNSRFGWDEARIMFDLSADLNGVYNWNVKLLFVYLELKYEAPGYPNNEVIIWDKIIERDQFNPETGKLEFKTEKAKYIMRTRSHDLRGAEVKVRLVWEVTPIVGFVYKMYGDEFKITFPTSYTRACSEERLSKVRNGEPMIITLKSQQSKHRLPKITSCPTLREYTSSPGFSPSLEKRKLSNLPEFFKKRYDIVSKALGEELTHNTLKQQSRQRVKESKSERKHSRPKDKNDYLTALLSKAEREVMDQIEEEARKEKLKYQEAHKYSQFTTYKKSNRPKLSSTIKLLGSEFLKDVLKRKNTDIITIDTPSPEFHHSSTFNISNLLNCKITIPKKSGHKTTTHKQSTALNFIINSPCETEGGFPHLRRLRSNEVL